MEMLFPTTDGDVMENFILNDIISFYFLIWESGSHHSPYVMDCYLSISSGDLTNTSSHICGSWYLPIIYLGMGH